MNSSLQAARRWASTRSSRATVSRSPPKQPYQDVGLAPYRPPQLPPERIFSATTAILYYLPRHHPGASQVSKGTGCGGPNRRVVGM